MSKSESVLDKSLTLHGMFELQAEKTPEAIALVLNDEQLSYRELNQRANQLAHYLNSIGVTSETLVGICLERSIETIVGMLGILKAGGAFVPLSSSLPQERIAFILEDTKVEILLTIEKLTEEIPTSGSCFVCLDAESEDISTKSKDNPVNSVQSDNLAYIIYTSGSTGKPKGVMVNHHAICQGFSWMQEISPITSRDRSLQKLPLTFDFSFWELFWPLTVGASVVLAKPGGERDNAYLVELIARQKISILVFVPSVLQVFLDEKTIENCKNIRMVFTGGEPLTSTLKDKFFKQLPGCLLYDHFGATENIVVTYWSCNAEEKLSSFSRGRLFPNVSIYVVDEQMQPVPLGEPGELLVGGWGLARGYLNRPELTAQKFIANPFDQNSQERLYRTGDLVRCLDDGTIEILGRIDHQVKIRGFRIELGEVEAILAQHPAVQQAVVIVREDVPGDKRLIAYYITQQKTIPPQELREFLQHRLPQYMLPASFVRMDTLPLAPNGKVNRRALPAPELTRAEFKNPFAAPRTPTEIALAEIWTEVLKIDQIGIYDEFLELGGHSLLAIQIISRITDIFGVKLSISILFSASTIAELAKHLIETNHQPQPFFAPSIQPVVKNQPLPLSYGQERLWFLSQLMPDVPVYNEPFTICFPSAVNVNALERAINEIIKRHESLRTRFIAIEGKPFQVIEPHSPFCLRVIDLRHLPLGQRQPEALQIATLEAKQPFNLATDLLLRATLIQLDNDDYWLFLTMHHIIMDGVSLYSVFLPELAALYEAIVHHRLSPLPELPVQYGDFAVWQRCWLQEEVLESHLAYWKQQFSGELPQLQLLGDYPKSAHRSFRGARQCLTLPKFLTDKLKALSQQEGVTLYTVLLAAFKVLLHRYTGQHDIVVGTVSAGRSRPEIEGLIGFFLNTLALRTDLSDLHSFRQLLAQVQSVTHEALAYEDLPFEQLVEALKLDRSSTQNPLFQVAFVLEPLMPSLECGWTVSQLDIHTETAKFDINLELDERPEGIIGRFEYSTELFDDATIARMIGHFQTLLESIIAHPDQAIAELPLLTESERQQLLVEWNDTQTQYPQDKCIHQLFEEQVERTPDAIAVVFENQQLTYRELNQRANQLAHYLQTLGVGPEVLVGICVERSLEMVIGILGILKVGGAYVPIDPAYPQDRLAFMLEDAAVPVLLTQLDLSIKFSTAQLRIVYLDKDKESITQQSQKNLENGAKSEDLAYIIYTSGSTGNPKGVAIEHHNTVALLAWARKVFNSEDFAGVLAATSICFDLSVFELFVPLSWGGKIVLAQNILSLLDLPTACEVTLINTVPSGLSELLPIQGLPSSVRIVNLAGEPPPRKLVQKLYQQGTLQQIFNLYGPSEDTTYSTYALINKQDTAITIGRPIANTQIYILDRHLQPVPLGVAGELHIGGDGLARGYLNRPELTAEKFIPNPFSDEPGSRLYKTGDLARYLSDGNIEFLGRIDHQVKIRGFRIELGEVEAALSQHPDVREAVVTVREDVPGDKRLVAYITSTLMPDRLPYQSECLLKLDGNTFKLRTEDISNGGIGLVDAPAMAERTPVRLHLPLPGADEAQWFNGVVVRSHSSAAGIRLQLTASEQTLLDQSITYLLETQGLLKTWQRTIAQSLRQFLKGKLPDYMVPRAFVLMQSLPLTPNGKIDRRTLPAPNYTQNSVSDRSATPHTAIQKTLATIWSNVLGVSSVGIHDNFFELGGDSIRSIQIISRAKEAGLQITPKQMFEYQTIAELAAVVSTARLVESEQGLISGSIPLTPIQHWFFEQNLPKVDHFNQAFLLEVHQAIDTNLLKQAVQQLLIHHDALRLQFTQTEFGWQQVNLLPGKTVPFSVINLSTLPELEQAAEIEAYATKLQTSLDISVGSLLQAILFDLGIHRPSRLLIVIHHLAVDGVSWRILLEDLQTVYQQLESEQPIQLPPKTTSFKTWAEQLAAYTRSSISELHLADWLHLATAPVTALPLDFDAQATIVASTQTVTQFLDTEETDALLKKVPRIYQTQINDVLLTALAQVLASWCNSRHTLVNLEGHGREDILPTVDLSRTVGWFTSIFPVLLELPVTGDLGDTLISIKEQLRRVPNRGVSYGLLRYLSGDTEIASSLEAIPKAEVSFNYLGQFDWGAKPDDLFKLASEPIGSEHDPQGLRAHLLDINGMVVEGRLQLEWTYSRNLHQADTIERLAQDYMERLRSLITHCLEAEVQDLSSDLAITLPSRATTSITAPIPLSFAQYNMWESYVYELEEASPGGSAANVTIALRFTGELSEKVLEKSLNEIIRRHEILRTTFTVVDEQPRQTIISDFNLALDVMDLQSYIATEREAEAEKLANQAAQYHFDLTRTPAIKATLLQLNSEEYWLLITMHHILMDRWSSNLLHQELEVLYGAFSNNLPSPLPELPIQYADFAVWQQQTVTKKVLANRLAYWQQKLASLHQLDFFPVQYSQVQKSCQPPAFYSLNLSTALVTSIRQLSRSQKVSVFVIILTALNILLFHWSKKTDIVILAMSSDRDTLVLEQLIGCFVIDVLMRIQIDVAQTVTTLLEQVSQTVNEALINQNIPISQIWDSVSELESLRTILISMAPSIHTQEQKLIFEPLQLSVEHKLFSKQHLPLELYVEAGAETIEFYAYYCTDTFTEQTIEQFFSCYQQILGLLTQNLGIKISEIE